MLILDFGTIDESSYEPLLATENLQSLEAWPRGWLLAMAFFGPQIFRVGACDFSGDYPVLGFARQLNVIAHNLKYHGKNGVYVDPELEKASRTEFSLDGDQVVITEVDQKMGAERPLCSARVPLVEFVSASEQYLERVLNHCYELVPRMKGRPEVQKWLDDRTDTGYLPFSNL